MAVPVARLPALSYAAHPTACLLLRSSCWLLLFPVLSAGVAFADDSAALVQVEVSFAERGAVERRAGHFAALQEHHDEGARFAQEASSYFGSFYEADLYWSPSTGMKPYDPEKVEKIMRGVRSYVATANDFSTAATAAAERLQRSPAHESRQAKEALKGAFEGLLPKALAFEEGFAASIANGLEAMPMATTEMASEQIRRVKQNMHLFINPIIQMDKVISRGDSDPNVCVVMASEIADLRKHGRVLVTQNRQQVQGTRFMIERMSDMWKPYVNVTLVRELGAMAAQTADSVEKAMQHIGGDMGEFANERLHCSSNSAGRCATLIWLAFAAICLNLGCL